MFSGWIIKVGPLSEALDSERKYLVTELVEEALREEEIAGVLEPYGDISEAGLRSAVLSARDDLLWAANSEEETLRKQLRSDPTAYKSPHWQSLAQLENSILVFEMGLALLTLICLGLGMWSIARQWTTSTLGAIVAVVIAAVLWFGLFMLVYVVNRNLFVNIARFLFWVGTWVPFAYAQYLNLGGEQFALAFSIGILIVGPVLTWLFLFLDGIESRERVEKRNGVDRYIPSQLAAYYYQPWRQALREGVLAFLRRRINRTLLERFSIVLSVDDAPGLRYLGDLKYHVPSAARDELIQRVDGVEGGSFALAGPRGAGKTILIRSFCSGRYASEPGRDLGVVVSAPVDYAPRDFVLYLYAEVCKETRAYVERMTAPAGTERLLKLAVRKWGRRLSSRAITPLGHPAVLADLARLAEQKLRQARYLQTFSTEVSGKVGVSVTEFSAKVATSLAEQPLTYPEIVADLRGFLQTVADTLRANALHPKGESAEATSRPRLFIGIDELDRIGSGEGARRFLDDIKAIFWVRSCYFLVSVSEDALRAFELAGHGMRDVFDSAFDEVIRVEHLDYEGSTNLLRARVTGLSVPFHALAYCLSGGLPRELMRAARAIVDQQDPTKEIKLGQVTARLVADELRRHCHAARLLLADTPGAAAAVELVHLLDEECPPTDADLRGFADASTVSASECSSEVQLVAYTVATHAYYLAALCRTFNDELRMEDVENATNSEQPIGRRYDTLARARRYLGVNDAFARMLIDSFLQAPRVGATTNAKDEPATR